MNIITERLSGVTSVLNAAAMADLEDAGADIVKVFHVLNGEFVQRGLSLCIHIIEPYTDGGLH